MSSEEMRMVDDAYAFLRGHTAADLRFDEHFRPIRYVVGPDGRLVAPVMVAMLESGDTVLYIPEVAEGALEVQVTLEQFKERGPEAALCDRWRIYHGDPPDVYWAYLHIDAARYAGMIIDGQAVTRINPLADVEAKLCRWMNEEHGKHLHLMCREFAHLDLAEVKPKMVGMDPTGVDIRSTFQVVRAPTPRPVDNPDEARQVLEDMVRQAIREQGGKGDGHGESEAND